MKIDWGRKINQGRIGQCAAWRGQSGKASLKRSRWSGVLTEKRREPRKSPGKNILQTGRETSEKVLRVDAEQEWPEHGDVWVTFLVKSPGRVVPWPQLGSSTPRALASHQVKPALPLSLRPG